MLFSKNILYF